jgi:uncharacterized membrane protein
MSNFLESKKIRAILWILGGLIVLFVVFGLGIFVGYGRAGFAAGFDRNYYRNFYGTGAPSAGPIGVHGIVGTVIDLGTSTISVTDQESNEQSVAVSSGTVIREQNNDITISGIEVGDQIAVIGEPNNQGQVSARFIRVFPASSSVPMPQSQ